MGLQSTTIPREKWSELRTAKELFDICGIDDHAALVEANSNVLMGVREAVRVGQAAQAEKMLTRSKKYLAPVEIGDFVTLPIPDVDKSVTSAPNLICRIVDIDYKYNLHELVCEVGVLSIMFARNCFDRLEASDLSIIMNLDKQVSVREAARLIDIGGGQGMLKGNCNSACQTGKCKCKDRKVLCNSRCHHNNTKCKNK